MQRLSAIILGACLLLGVSNNVFAFGAELPSPDEMTYDVDPAALREEFRETGRFTIILPIVGQVKIAGIEAQTFSGEKLVYDATEGRDGATLIARLDSIAVVGEIEGNPASYARVLLGERGAYGQIETPSSRYLLDPVDGGDGSVQKVKYLPQEDPTWMPPAPSGASSYLDGVPSKLVLDAEYDYRLAHSDWASRLESAFFNFQPMWSNLGVDLTLHGVFGVGNFVTSTKNYCSGTNSANGAYRDWLQYYLISGVDAYGLATKANLRLTNGDWGCLGSGNTDSFKNGAYANAVFEDHDIPFQLDYYNPDVTYERGLVAGQELAHVYGEQFHRDLSCSNNCNIMDNLAVNTRAYWFVEQSKIQIQQCVLWANCT